MPLPKDQEALRELRDSLADLAHSLGYQQVAQRLQDLVSQAQRLLEEAQGVEVPRLQGQLSAYKRCVGLVAELKREIDHTVNGGEA